VKWIWKRVRLANQLQISAVGATLEELKPRTGEWSASMASQRVHGKTHERPAKPFAVGPGLEQTRGKAAGDP
jgi:hypothetical protein